MIETDDNFEPHTDGYDYLVDFADLSFPTKRPDREHPYIEVRRCKAPGKQNTAASCWGKCRRNYLKIMYYKILKEQER